MERNENEGREGEEASTAGMHCMQEKENSMFG